MFDKSFDVGSDQETAAFTDYSHASALFWLDILVFCAILAAVAACF